MSSAYTQMVLRSDGAPPIHNTLAALATWVIFSGFFLLPGAFTSLEKSNLAQIAVLHTLSPARSVLLPVLAGVGYTAGAFGIWRLWAKYPGNYIWLSGHLLIPVIGAAINSLAAVLINVYTAQAGHWSAPAIFALVMAASTFAASVLVLCVFEYRLKKIRVPRSKSVMLGANTTEC